MSDVVHFYRVKDPYGCFSNLAPFPIEMDGVVWPTSEHWFQAQKFVGTPAEAEMAAAIRDEPSPMKAALMGRDRTKPRREGWEAIRDDLMRQAVRAKFAQHADIREVLLGTGDAAIVEHTANDDYWGMVGMARASTCSARFSSRSATCFGGRPPQERQVAISLDF